jgi:DNA-binding NarL/FixJ family response regulator
MLPSSPLFAAVPAGALSCAVAGDFSSGAAMLTDADEPDPAECICAIVEPVEPAHAFLVHLRRADGQRLREIAVESEHDLFTLLRAMNLGHVFFCVTDDEAREALIRAFTDGDEDPTRSTRTLH